MNGLMTVQGLNKRDGRTRVMTAFALAALVLLSIMPAPARGQSGGMGAGKVSMNDFHFVMRTSVGVGRGQSVRLSLINPLFLDGSVRILNGHVRVFDGLIGAELQNHEINNPPAGLHSFDIRRDDLTVAGEPPRAASSS